MCLPRIKIVSSVETDTCFVQLERYPTPFSLIWPRTKSEFSKHNRNNTKTRQIAQRKRHGNTCGSFPIAKILHGILSLHQLVVMCKRKSRQKDHLRSLSSFPFAPSVDFRKNGFQNWPFTFCQTQGSHSQILGNCTTPDVSGTKQPDSLFHFALSRIAGPAIIKHSELSGESFSWPWVETAVLNIGDCGHFRPRYFGPVRSHSRFVHNATPPSSDPPVWYTILVPTTVPQDLGHQ